MGDRDKRTRTSRSVLLHSVVEITGLRETVSESNKTTITKGLMEAPISMYTTNPLLIKRTHVSRSFRLNPEFKMMVWTVTLLVLFKIILNWIKKCFLELSVVVHAYSFNTGQDEARDQQFEAILGSVVKKNYFYLKKKNSFFALGASHISV